jgi:hypothetical protein
MPCLTTARRNFCHIVRFGDKDQIWCYQWFVTSTNHTPIHH